MATTDGGIVEAAQYYAGRGWHVFPVHSWRGTSCSCARPECEHPAKHPRTARGFKDASTDSRTIHGWWMRWPDANVAIVTGKISGVIALDIDPRHDGLKSLAIWEREHGSLPATLESETGGGGFHKIFRHPGFVVKNRVGILPGIDIRGDGGYIVVPPSVHPSGRRYRWKR